MKVIEYKERYRINNKMINLNFINNCIKFKWSNCTNFEKQISSDWI